MVVVDDRTSEFLEEVRRALEASRDEAGLPPAASSPGLADITAAVRDGGLSGALNNLTAATISTTVSEFGVVPY